MLEDSTGVDGVKQLDIQNLPGTTCINHLCITIAINHNYALTAVYEALLQSIRMGFKRKNEKECNA